MKFKDEVSASVHKQTNLTTMDDYFALLQEIEN